MGRKSQAIAHHLSAGDGQGAALHQIALTLVAFVLLLPNSLTLGLLGGDSSSFLAH